MGFSAKRCKALKRNLDQRYVRSRFATGRELSYIKGWYAISRANLICGFDGWNRETVESRCVLNRENRGAEQTSANGQKSALSTRNVFLNSTSSVRSLVWRSLWFLSMYVAASLEILGAGSNVFREIMTQGQPRRGRFAIP